MNVCHISNYQNNKCRHNRERCSSDPLHVITSTMCLYSAGIQSICCKFDSKFLPSVESHFPWFSNTSLYRNLDTSKTKLFALNYHFDFGSNPCKCNQQLALIQDFTQCGCMQGPSQNC